MEAPKQAKPGQLVLKGGLVLKRNKRSKKARKAEKAARKAARKRKREAAAATAGGDAVEERKEQAAAMPERKHGSGRLITSGTTVTGVDTVFMQELRAGDAVIVRHPLSLMEETRIVRMVVSDISFSLSSAFSSDLISSTRFDYINAPRVDSDAPDGSQPASKKAKRDEEEKAAFGTYAGSRTLVYREAKPGVYGGYRIVKKQLDKEMSREELLDMRVKAKGDRHC
eukprot:PLAT5610.1.p3 GENE.PLAT5610.1~~PLAT5610.1.p3  ORF type:complete len:226 (-),score=127.09 PLAT5610.1:1027-1704(-)